MKGGHIPGLGGCSAAGGDWRLQAQCENRGWVEVSWVDAVDSRPGAQGGGAEPAAAEGKLEAGQGYEIGGGGGVSESSGLSSKDTEVKETSD